MTGLVYLTELGLLAVLVFALVVGLLIGTLLEHDRARDPRHYDR